MEKQYNHKNYESDIYKKWEEEDAFKPSKSKKSFCIIMPPPNANDPLHIGHARFVAIEDTLTRYARLKGFSTLWLPGSDHAGIETQFVFEKRLREEGKSRFDFDRDKLYKMIWEYVEKNTDVMQSQLKALGASCDWSRHKFTLDKDIQKIVHSTFKKLYDEGLVYRGERIVNYCPICGTNFSELEVNYEEERGEMYFLDYKTVTIATTRPETIFADVAVAVNPNDKRYKHLIGKTAIIPIINREIPIIADKAVDINFGTGALKITPGHDPLDFEIGQRHNLSIVTVIDSEGKITNSPEDFVGMKAKQARLAVVDRLKEEGLLKETKEHLHSVGRCYRCKSVIEPLISKQWFVKMDPLAKKALIAIKNKDIKFAAKKYEKQAIHWLKNIRDWNVSRQIVWGMRIPAFRCDKCLEWHITEGEVPQSCSCGSSLFTQDTDTFDTWFSSGQWPFATLKASKQPGDFESFYPTTVMNTSYDIILFWVLRMLMLGLFVTGEVPFENVVIHGLVRDKNGVKISKSKGNVINPIEMVEKYGSDSLRTGILWGALVENDISLSEDNIKGQRNFANKLWNIARFIEMDLGKLQDTNYKIQKLNSDDKEILNKLKLLITKTEKNIEKYKLNIAIEDIYNFVWNDLANKYIESIKEKKIESLPVLLEVLRKTLIISHPFMPFVTEAIWSEMKLNKESDLINSRWPDSN